jgi:SAM-dependent methyltransferase
VSADFARAPFADSSWDVIALFHMLEHVPDPGAHLRSAHRLLAAGGHLVVAVPNFASLQRRIFGLRWNGLDVPRHLHHFRLRDLQALLEQSGFQITRTRYFSWRDSPAGLATTLAPSLDPMRSRAAFPAAYALLTALCVPLALLEAALHRGSTLIVEAKRV